MVRRAPPGFAAVLLLSAACSLDIGGTSGQRQPFPLDASSDAGPRDAATVEAGSSDAATDSGQPDAATDASLSECADAANSRCLLALTALSSSTGALTPSFDPGVEKYHLDVSIWTESVELTPSADAPAKLSVGGDAVKSGSSWSSPALAFGDNTFSIVVTQAEHPTRKISVVVTRRAQADILTAKRLGLDDGFGHRVALSGDTMLVAAPLRDVTRGAVYVFIRKGKGWAQQALLTATHGSAGDRFGNSMTFSGNSVVIGAPGEDSDAQDVNGDETSELSVGSGAAYVFVRTGTAWAQQAYLKAGFPGASDGFGTSVAIDGDTVVVGAPGEDSDGVPVGINPPNEAAPESGAAYVFVRSAGQWAPEAYVKAPGLGSGDGLGAAVAVSGERMLVAAPLEDGGASGVDGSVDEAATDSGAAYVFLRTGTQWTSDAYLKASNPGARVSSTDTGDQFGGGDQFAGRSIAMWGDTVVIGAAGEDSQSKGIGGNQSDNTQLDAGAVYVFVRGNSAWSQQAYVKAHHPTDGGQFGSSVALEANRMVIGAWQEAGAATNINGDAALQSVNRAGAAYSFERSAGVWKQKHYLKARAPAADDQFGWSVGLSDDVVVVGARGQGLAGSVFIF